MQENYDEIQQRAKDATTCHYRHHCERYDQVMSAWPDDKERDKFSVWDKIPYESNEHDDSEAEQLFSGTAAECLKYLESSGVHLEESGVCTVCDMYDARKKAVKEDRHPYFLVVAWGLSRYCYSNAEGGCWSDWLTIIEVRKVYTWEAGLKAMREMRGEHPQPRFNRFSCANRGEDDVQFGCFYGEDDPRFPQETTQSETYS